ncbi:MAG: tetratricopeptide repeat protein [Armatimonadetes bacterium]|nr:tetratricopeptide repeat protein [Akkermansiaceae bacterium]
MIKVIAMGFLILLVGGSWFMFYKTGDEARELEQRIEKLYDTGDPDEQMPELKTRMHTIEGQRVFNGILLAFLSAGLVGIVFVTQILPRVAEKLTHAVYDSGEMVEKDLLHAARVLVAQGEWDEAIEAFKIAAEKDPRNRMPWTEIAKIQRTHLEDPAAAILTLREVIEGQEWEESDAAFLMFRLAEIYDEDTADRAAAVAIMEQVMEQFPQTRHAANARNKLHEWGMA